MIGRLRTHVRKQPIIVLYFEFENELKFYNLQARSLANTEGPIKCRIRRYSTRVCTGTKINPIFRDIEMSISDPSKYQKDNAILIVSICMKYSIRKKRVEVLFALSPLPLGMASRALNII